MVVRRLSIDDFMNVLLGSHIHGASLGVWLFRIVSGTLERCSKLPDLDGRAEN